MTESSKWASISDLHEITRIDRATIRKRLAGLKPKIGDRNAKLYDKQVALTALLASQDAISESNAKERKAIAEAGKAELILRKLKGELVPASAMRTAVAELIKTLYARTVRVSPSILASKLSGKTNTVEIETIIREELATVFNELKTMPEKFLTIDEESVLAEAEETDESDGD